MFLKVINHDHHSNFTLSVPLGYFHNPYFYEHMRLDEEAGARPARAAVPVSAPPSTRCGSASAAGTTTPATAP